MAYLGNTYIGGTLILSPVGRTSGASPYLTITTPADSGQTASTESIGVNFTAATRTWATGALTLQREHVFAAPTYAFAGASTLTTAVNVDIANPVAGTGATITSAWALRSANTLLTGTVQLSGLTASRALVLDASKNIAVTGANLTLSTALTVQTGAVTITGNASGSTLVLPSGSTTLASASTYSVADSTSAEAIGTSTALTTERRVYYGLPTINNAHNYTSSTTIYAPSAGGTAGTFLIAAGATSTPGWSTSTIPTSAGATAGKYLVSDGTNYVLSSYTLTLGANTTINTSVANYAAYYSGTNAISGEQYLALSRGGTNAGLTASNGGIVYSTSSALAIKAAGTAGQALVSNGANAPNWTTGTLTLSTNLTVQTGALVLAAHASGTTATFPATGSITLVDTATAQSLTNKKLGSLTSNGFVKTSGSDGTLSVDTSTYLTANQTITLSGDASGSGTTAITVTVADDSHRHTTSTLPATMAPSNHTLVSSVHTASGLTAGHVLRASAAAAFGFAAIADGDLPSALTGKTYNALTLTAAATGFTIAGGTTSKTLTVGGDASVSGTNTGDVSLATNHGLSLTNQVIGMGAPSSITSTSTNSVTTTTHTHAITGEALTKTDDTNVTLTLGGTPATGLVKATSLTLGWTGQLSLARGGTAASLTASNGGIVYSTGSALAILAGTATASKMLLSGASTTPSWSSYTVPATATAGDIWYASATNTITALPKGANGQVLKLVSGLPVWDATSLRSTQDFTATANQTTFTVSGGYVSSAMIDVYMNGMLLSPTDYTATDLSTVVLASGATVGDLIRIVSYNAVSIAGTASYATVAGAIRIVEDNAGAGTKYPVFAGTSQTGDLVPNTDNGFTYVPSTGTLTSLIFSGAVKNSSSSASIGSGVVGQIHFTAPTNTYYQGLTFASAGADTPQAGIWVQNDNSAGTTMRFQTTNSYATGPQTRLTISPDGTLTFPGVTVVTNSTAASSTTTGALKVTGGISSQGNIYGAAVYNAVWNDIADFLEVPEDTIIEFGRVYTRVENRVQKTFKKGQKAIGIASDTFGFGVGKKNKGKELPIAIGGWVLAHVDKNYTFGTALVATKNGKLTKASLLLRLFCPSRILAVFDRQETGITWNGVEVNGRHWVKVI